MVATRGKSLIIAIYSNNKNYNYTELDTDFELESSSLFYFYKKLLKSLKIEYESKIDFIF